MPMIHTKKGDIVNEPIRAKFFAGAYDEMKVYIPPNAGRQLTAADA